METRKRKSGTEEEMKRARTRLSTGTLIMSGTSTSTPGSVKSVGEEPTSPSNSSTTGSEITLSGEPKKADTILGKRRAVQDLDEETPLPPKQRKIGRNDGSGEDNKNDYYCWLCHQEGLVMCCELCPRVYHAKCLNIETVPQDWVCPECEKIMRAECVDTRSEAMSNITLDLLCTLLKYAVEQMRACGHEAFEHNVDPEQFPTYSDYIFHPVCLSTLEKNIKKKAYGCTESLLADAKWIYHNAFIFNGGQSKVTQAAKILLKVCKHEMTEIEVCPDCYLHSCLKSNTNWFCQPCRSVHPLVWAKLKGYPYWPAKVLREVNGQVDVRFFGAHDRSWVPASVCYMLSKQSPVVQKKARSGFDLAMKEVYIHVGKLKEKFGSFSFAPSKTEYNKKYMDVMLGKGSKGKGQSSRTTRVSSLKSRSEDSPQSDSQSAASKTAMAVKSKYSNMASRKSATDTQQKQVIYIKPVQKGVFLLSEKTVDTPSKADSGPNVPIIRLAKDTDKEQGDKESTSSGDQTEVEGTANTKESSSSSSSAPDTQGSVQAETNQDSEENAISTTPSPDNEKAQKDSEANSTDPVPSVPMVTEKTNEGENLRKEVDESGDNNNGQKEGEKGDRTSSQTDNTKDKSNEVDKELQSEKCYEMDGATESASKSLNAGKNKEGTEIEERNKESLEKESELTNKNQSKDNDITCSEANSEVSHKQSCIEDDPMSGDASRGDEGRNTSGAVDKGVDDQNKRKVSPSKDQRQGQSATLMMDGVQGSSGDACNRSPEESCVQNPETVGHIREEVESRMLESGAGDGNKEVGKSMEGAVGKGDKVEKAIEKSHPRSDVTESVSGKESKSVDQAKNAGTTKRISDVSAGDNDPRPEERSDTVSTSTRLDKEDTPKDPDPSQDESRSVQKEKTQNIEMPEECRNQEKNTLESQSKPSGISSEIVSEVVAASIRESEAVIMESASAGKEDESLVAQKTVKSVRDGDKEKEYPPEKEEGKLTGKDATPEFVKEPLRREGEKSTVATSEEKEEDQVVTKERNPLDASSGEAVPEGKSYRESLQKLIDKAKQSLEQEGNVAVPRAVTELSDSETTDTSTTGGGGPQIEGSSGPESRRTSQDVMGAEEEPESFIQLSDGEEAMVVDSGSDGDESDDDGREKGGLRIHLDDEDDNDEIQNVNDDESDKESDETLTDKQGKDNKSDDSSEKSREGKGDTAHKSKETIKKKSRSEQTGLTELHVVPSESSESSQDSVIAPPVLKGKRPSTVYTADNQMVISLENCESGDEEQSDESDNSVIEMEPATDKNKQSVEVDVDLTTESVTEDIPTSPNPDEVTAESSRPIQISGETSPTEKAADTSQDKDSPLSNNSNNRVNRITVSVNSGESSESGRQKNTQGLQPSETGGSDEAMEVSESSPNSRPSGLQSIDEATTIPPENSQNSRLSELLNGEVVDVPAGKSQSSKTSAVPSRGEAEVPSKKSQDSQQSNVQNGDSGETRNGTAAQQDSQPGQSDDHLFAALRAIEAHGNISQPRREERNANENQTTKDLVTKTFSELQSLLSEKLNKLAKNVEQEVKKKALSQTDGNILKKKNATLTEKLTGTIMTAKQCLKESVAVFEAEKAKLKAELEAEFRKELEKRVTEAKKHQWCAECLKEAVYYCCWNTSYCSYACQQKHWVSHMPKCLQTSPSPGQPTQQQQALPAQQQQALPAQQQQALPAQQQQALPAQQQHTLPAQPQHMQIGLLPVQQQPQPLVLTAQPPQQPLRQTGMSSGLINSGPALATAIVSTLLTSTTSSKPSNSQRQSLTQQHSNLLASLQSSLPITRVSIPTLGHSMEGGKGLGRPLTQSVQVMGPSHQSSLILSPGQVLSSGSLVSLLQPGASVLPGSASTPSTLLPLPGATNSLLPTVTGLPNVLTQGFNSGLSQPPQTTLGPRVLYQTSASAIDRFSPLS